MYKTLGYTVVLGGLLASAFVLPADAKPKKAWTDFSAKVHACMMEAQSHGGSVQHMSGYQDMFMSCMSK